MLAAIIDLLHAEDAAMAEAADRQQAEHLQEQALATARRAGIRR